MPENDKNLTPTDITPPTGTSPFVIGLESKEGNLQIVQNVYGFAYCDRWLVLKFKDVESWVDATNLKDIRLNLQLSNERELRTSHS